MDNLPRSNCLAGSLPGQAPSRPLAAAPLGLTVFLGIHTFLGTVKEIYPTNHFLQVALLAMLREDSATLIHVASPVRLTWTVSLSPSALRPILSPLVSASVALPPVPC